MAGNNYTVEVSNVSFKVTAREIEDFFSFSGQVEKVDLNSDGEDSQVAYVTFKDHDSLKMALLLSGSAILDKEVKILALTHSGPEELACEPGDESIQAGESSAVNPRSGALNRVRAMLSRGGMVGKGAVKSASTLDPRNNSGVNAGHNTRISSNDMGDGDAASAAAATPSVASPTDSTTLGGKPKAGITMQTCYKHVSAINEKLQIGQRTMSALAMAQQGVASAGSAVASNRYVAAGGVWVSGAISRVTNKPINNDGEAGHGNHDSPSHKGGAGHHGEQVQLTEMTSFQSHKPQQD